MSQNAEEYCAVWNARCGVYLHSIAGRRTGAISAHVTRQETSWTECRRRGDRLVKIRIAVVGDEQGAAN